MNTSKIRAAPDVATLRTAVADAIEGLSEEKTILETLTDIEFRLKLLETP